MLPPHVQTALRLPAFLLAVGALYWSAAIVGLMYKIKWLSFRGKRNDLLGWARGMETVFGFTVRKVGGGQLYRGNCIYLVNHRSWADMLVDQYVTEGRAMFMSRWAMFFVFPPLLTVMLAMKVILFFKRGSIADKDGFNKWIDRKFQESPQTALVVYPEGHRNTRAQSLPLKRGMLYYAFSRKLPVQVVIGLNKEAIISEKHLVARVGQTVAVGYSGVVDPSRFGSIDAFMSEVQATWDAQWQQVFSAKMEGLPELALGPPDFDYPTGIRAAVSLAIPLNILLLLATAYYVLRWGAALLALCGPLRLPAQVLLAGWVAASLLQASRPVNALEAQEKRRSSRAQRGGPAVGKAAAPASAVQGQDDGASASTGKDE